MTNHPAPELLSDEQIVEIEVRLKLWAEHEIPHSQYPASWEEVSSLCATVRAQQDLLQLADYAAEEFRRQAEQIIAEVERERETLREQLAHAKDLDASRCDDIGILQSRLAQVEKERDAYKLHVEAPIKEAIKGSLEFGNRAALRMRERCVEKMREVMRPYELEFRRKTNSATNIVDYVAIALESLTLDEKEPTHV